ncbi:Zinc finger protein [Plecturocebus cupreus]
MLYMLTHLKLHCRSPQPQVPPSRQAMERTPTDSLLWVKWFHGDPAQWTCDKIDIRDRVSLECSGMIIAHGIVLELLTSSSSPASVSKIVGTTGSSNSPASASQVAGTTVAYQHAQLIFVFLVEMGFYHVGHAGLELLTSSDPHALGLPKCWDYKHEPPHLAPGIL